MGLLSPSYNYPPGSGAPAPSAKKTFLAPSYVSYSNSGGAGGGSSTDDGLPGSQRCPSNVINDLIEPTYNEYPLPASPAYTPGSSSPGSSSTSASSSSGAATGSAQTAQTAMMQLTPPHVVRTMLTNPQFPAPATPPTPTTTARRGGGKHPKVHHVSGGKGNSATMIEIESPPLTLTVPPNCNAMEVILGAIEPAPGGSAQDIAAFVDAGKQRIADIGGGELDENALNPGDQVLLFVPWRAPADAKIDAGKARRSVRVEFYSSIQNASGAG